MNQPGGVSGGAPISSSPRLGAYKPLFHASLSQVGGDESDDDTDSDEDDDDEGPASRQACVMQIDDEADEDAMAVCLDPIPPLHVYMCNTEQLPGMDEALKRVGKPAPLCLGSSAGPDEVAADSSLPLTQVLTAVRRVQWVATKAGTSTKKAVQYLPVLSTAAAPQSGGRPAGPAAISSATSGGSIYQSMVERLGGSAAPRGPGSNAPQGPKSKQATIKARRERNERMKHKQKEKVQSLANAKLRLTGLNQLFSSLFHDLHAEMCYKVRGREAGI